MAGFIESCDIQVERGVGGLETAFRATIPGGAGEGPTIAVLAEYDALPEIGHGCGHNLIAMAAMAAALALSNALMVAKTLSLTASDLLRDATLLESAKIEFADRSN